MAMSKKDYVAVAALVKQAKSDIESGMHFHNALEKMSYEMGTHFKRDNPRFDFGRFLSACDFERN